MDPLNQAVINWALTLAGICGGWVLKILYDKLHDLQVADLALADKVQSIEVLVAGQYIKRTEMEKMYEAMFAKLDRIETKIDRKVDKQ
jgi:hypothetical protein